MTCLLCVALGCLGTIAVSFAVAVGVGWVIKHANERSDAAWAELNEEDDQ